MLRRNKKGIGLEWYMLIVAVFIGFMAFFVSYFSGQRIMDNFIGNYQFSILRSVQESEKTLFYIDQSAQYSLEQSVYDLAKNGGVSEIEVSDAETFAGYECGKFNDAYVWYQVEKQGDTYTPRKCVDENFAEINLPYIFNKNLNKYLLNYPSNIPTDNYEFKLAGNLEIIGIAVLPVKIDIFKKNSAEQLYKGTETKKTESIDTKQLIAETSKTLEGLRDFTETDLCAKGTSCLLTEEAFQLLLKSEELAIKKGVSLQVTNGYRSKDRQIAAWEGKTADRYAQKYPDPAERRKYVANPYECGNNCPHYSGKVIDIRFKGKTRETMTGADWNNLYSIMTSADSNRQPLWVKYSNEPWHFECCNTPRYARAIQQGVTSIV